eukprot:scaffold32372_cov27-Phaeocystis_antarctica.AAC.1
MSAPLSVPVLLELYYYSSRAGCCNFDATVLSEIPSSSVSLSLSSVRKRLPADSGRGEGGSERARLCSKLWYC